ncbi:MAG TPA: GNAT family N-acetyltransferase [Ilumatobacteraceae bacterium]
MALRVADAEEMVVVLADPALHQFTGGRPASLEELRGRYTSWAGGSGSVDELWLNWIVRRDIDNAAVGAVQATVVHPHGEPIGEVAWTIGTAWQRQGFATEAAVALVQWLFDNGAESVVAHVHPNHIASARVAAAAGLRPTDNVVDGEVEWRLDRVSRSDQSV